MYRLDPEEILAIARGIGEDISQGHLKNLNKYLIILREREIKNAQKLASLSQHQAASLAILATGLYDNLLTLGDPGGMLVQEVNNVISDMQLQADRENMSGTGGEGE